MQKLRAVFGLLAIIWSCMANAQEIGIPKPQAAKGPQPNYTAWNGSYVDRIEIDVPSFRGLEPDLALVYDSSRGISNFKNVGGSLGVGWTLQGLSAIERTAGSIKPAAGIDPPSGGRGVPAYDAPGLPPDGFSLDGSELVACVATATVGAVQNPAATPSCAVPTASGWTAYATRNESYLRIRYNAVGNMWEVTSKSGIKSTYVSKEGADPKPFRWHLASVTDRRLNHVDYAWVCTALHCDIESIKGFNQGLGTAYFEIAFKYAVRISDKTTYATGKDIRTVGKRLGAIEIKANQQVLRAYALNFQESLATKLSQLVMVQLFGKDASVGSTGTVTGSPTLPPHQFSYSGIAFGGQFVQKSWPIQNSLTFYPSGGLLPGSAWAFGGDFDGDGRNLDLLYTTIYQTVYQSNGMHQYGCTQHGTFRGNAVFLGSQVNCNNPLDNANTSNIETEATFPIADYDGDGAEDFSRMTKETMDCRHDVISYCPPKFDLKFYKWWESSASPKNGSYGAFASHSTTSQSIISTQGGIGLVADFNGDGKTEVLMRNGSIWGVYNSTFVASLSTSITFPGANDYNRRVDDLDVNGDGKSDLLEQWFANGNWNGKLHISTGTGFQVQNLATRPWAENFDTSGWIVADANGDGNTDLITVRKFDSTSYQTRVFLSTGTQFDFSGVTAAPKLTSGFSTPAADGYMGTGTGTQYRSPAAHVGNFDSDNRADLIVRDGFSFRVLHNIVDQPILGANIALPGNLMSVVGDFTDDGLDDLFYNQATMHANPGKFPDLLTSITTPLGGKTTVSYRSSVGLPDTRVPFRMQVVDSIETSDGRGTVAKTEFAYEGGTWNNAERQFLGFRKVTATLPANAGEAAGPRVETYHQQSIGCVGKVSSVIQTTATGVPLSEQRQGFTIDSNVPYTCVNSSTMNLTYDPALTGAVKTTKTTRGFDGYGNETKVIEYGNLDVAGDESTMTTGFKPNTTDYIVGCPASQYTALGVNTTSYIAFSFNTYSPAGAYTDPPPGATGCELNKQQTYMGSTGYATSLQRFDAWGNVDRATDPLGNVTDTTYDADYQLFPEKLEAPLVTAGVARLASKTEWDKTCGLPVRQAGFNGAVTQTPLQGEVTTTAYDMLCRPTTVTTPGGAIATKSYTNLGNPLTQYIQTLSTQADGPGLSKNSKDYLDGFGRSYRTATLASGSSWINVQRLYHKRGEVDRETVPFYTGETPQWTNYDYDQLDRLKTTTNPDGSSSSLSYALAPATSANILDVTATAEHGKQQTYSLDADGQLTARTKWDGTRPVRTTYTRDVLGRITGVTDPKLNQWTYTYDQLGRRTQVKDPDLGTWTYAYDAASRLVTQTDAKAQITTLTYDAIGRVKTKTVTATGQPTEKTTNSYDEVTAPRSPFNLGKLTTTVRTVGTALPAASPSQTYDYDVAGRSIKTTYNNVNSQSKTLETEYWQDGSLKRKRLADGFWTGNSSYDLAGRFLSLDNDNSATNTSNGVNTSNPDVYIQSAQYNARGQTTSIVYGNGVTSTYAYNDQRGWLNRVLAVNGATTLLDQILERPDRRR